MTLFENEELTDGEVSQMLALWEVPDPSPDIRARIFGRGEIMPQTLSASIAGLELPWYQSLANNLRDLVRPQKLPPLDVTSKPVEVRSIWGAYAGGQKRSLGAAVLIQVCILTLMFGMIGVPIAQRVPKQTDTDITLNLYNPKLPAAQKASGGGGGGQRSPTPVARGAAPQFAEKQFIPPAIAVAKPLLPAVPTITAAAPQIDAANYGDPLSHLSGDSAGQGISGVGNGKNGGDGNGDGNGYRDGSGGGGGGDVFTAGGNVSSPILVSKVEPEYSEEARRAKYSGVVHLSVVIDERGVPTDIQVTGPLGLGLDERAVEAVKNWRFRPGLRNGRPVKVRAAVEVSFRLL